MGAGVERDVAQAGANVFCVLLTAAGASNGSERMVRADPFFCGPVSKMNAKCREEKRRGCGDVGRLVASAMTLNIGSVFLACRRLCFVCVDVLVLSWAGGQSRGQTAVS